MKTYVHSSPLTSPRSVFPAHVGAAGPAFRAWLVLLGLLGLGGVSMIGPAAQSTNDRVATGLRQWCAADTLPAVGTPEPVAAFFARTAYVPVWTQVGGPTPAALAGLRLLAEAPRYGLPLADYRLPQLRLLLDSVSQPNVTGQTRVRAEVQLTTALLRFARHLSRGRVEEPGLRPVAVGPAPAPDDLAVWLDQAVRGGELARELLAGQPTSRSYVRLLHAWQHLLRTDSLAAARLALPVALNLERLRWEPRPDSLSIIVNIPAFSLQVVRGPRVVATHRVIVGKAETPTPELYSRITLFQAAPEWRVPGTIAAQEMLPKLQRDPSLLVDKGFRVYTAAGRRVNPYRVAWDRLLPEDFTYQIRQEPSAGNALGCVVFRFANPYAIYLHDTPTKSAFRLPGRALSHGCVRVEDPLTLARFLLRHEDNPAQAGNRTQQLQASLNNAHTTAFPLHAAVPLIVRYLTCEADGGQLRQLPDVYGRDQALAQAWQASPAPGEGAATLALR